MAIVVRCPCGKQVRVDLDALHRAPRCPHCKRVVKVSLWRRVLARAQCVFGAREPSDSRSLTPITPQPSSGIEELLQELGQRAWRKETRNPAGSFLLAPATLGKGTDTKVLETNLRVLYEHARRWAPGLLVPYKVPRVTLSGALTDAGQYHVDSDGWVAIDVSAEFASRDPALQVILAHEACHHILDLTGLDDKSDRARTERMTDLAMFICGFGDIVRSGRTSVSQTASGYVRTHLGYLHASDYDYAYDWVLGARVANGLPGMIGSRLASTAMTTNFYLPDPVERLQRELASRILDGRVRERVIRHYQTKYPSETDDQLLKRIIEDYERDNR